MKQNRYRTPKFSEFVPGFKCQSCFWYFDREDATYTIDENDKYQEKWFHVEFTKEILAHAGGLFEADAYETEFRVLNNK